MLTAYKDNEVRADAMYKGKYLRVRGVVADIKKGLGDGMYVVLGRGSTARLEIPQIQCHLGPGQEKAAAALQGIWVTGRCDGLLMHVQLKDCDLD